MEKNVPVKLFFSRTKGGLTEFKEEMVPVSWLNDHLTSPPNIQSWAKTDKQDWHNAAGKVHLQLTRRGGTTILYGDPENPQRVHLGVGDIAIWQDSGFGHKAEHDDEGWDTMYTLVDVEVAL